MVFSSKKKHYPFGDLTFVQRRLEMIYTQRLKDMDRIAYAIRTQDELSKKSRSSWSGSAEIRKWRDRR